MDRYKWGQILDPTTALVRDVRVEEDDGSRVNFVAPGVVDACNLDRHPMKTMTFVGVSGVPFTANEWVELRWLGRGVAQGKDVFYIAPQTTPIDLLVGKDFLKGNPDVFMTEKPTEPAFLNVQKRMTVSKKK